MKDKFKQLEEQNPNLSSIMVFGKLVRGRKMHQKDISKWFSKLVDKEDWVGSPREQLTKFYWQLSSDK
jgi:hypothetical protein